MTPQVAAGGTPRAQSSGDVGMELFAATLKARITPAQIAALATRLRAVAREPLPAMRVAVALGTACERWRNRDESQRRETVGAVAAAWGWSEALLDESIDALMAPFSRIALENLARRVPRCDDLVGLIMPGNVPGAGIHEIATGLLSGCALMVKTATAEPCFFPRFLQTLREIDAEVAARTAVLNWSRERSDVTEALRSNCDWIVAFGHDETIAKLDSSRGVAGSEGGRIGGLLAGFGSRVSAALIGAELAAAPEASAVADAIARDVSLFEQQGCLSPHHIFVESPDARAARSFAGEMAAALERYADRSRAPRRYGLEEAAAVRRVRESARWRALGGAAITLLEGDGLAWTVVADDEASFTISPGYRTVAVSPYADLDDLERRLQPVAGRIEAFAIAVSEARRESMRERLAGMGVSYVCAPGATQSPPLDWSHGGGAFTRALAGAR